MDYRTLLNKEQYEAATYLDGHLRIVAGAGSGKTRVLTYRIAYLIQEIGIDPKSILAITFTNKAANEMRSRVESLLKDDAAGVLLCTIHSLCVRILRRHIHALSYPSSFVIIDEEDQKSLLKRFYKEHNIDSKQLSYRYALSEISRFKTKGIDPKEALVIAGSYQIAKNVAIIYNAYQMYLQENFMLDFDDLLIFTNRLLSENESIREYWQRRFHYIHVDEFQDVDYQNYLLIQLLTAPHTKVCVVGDPDQTIYTFRGADISYIMNFDKDFKGARTVYLNQNYRSTKTILEACNGLISNNDNRLKKDLFTTNGDGKKVVHYSADSDDMQAEYVVDKINDIISHVEGVNYADFAVLYRANYLSRTIEQAFMSNQIPYRIFGGLKFFSRKEIKDVLSYLRLLCSGDNLAFERIINVPSRKIGEKTIEKIRDQANLEGKSMYELCVVDASRAGISKAACNQINSLVNIIEECKDPKYSMIQQFERLIKKVGYIEMLENEQETDRIENVQELKNSMGNFMERNPGSSLADYLQEIALYTNQDMDDDTQHVSMMTVHMAKGLEFPYVFVVGLSEDIFPSARSVEESGRKGIEEERRLAYVAFTRAKTQLFLVDSQGFNFITGDNKTSSRFIDEIDDKYISHEGKENRYDSYNLYETKKDKAMRTLDVSDEVSWKVGDLLVHTIFGKGVVLKVDGKNIQVAFPIPYGVKTLIGNHPTLKKA